MNAKGSIDGLVVANQNLAIDAKQNVNVTALASGTASQRVPSRPLKLILIFIDSSYCIYLHK